MEFECCNEGDKAGTAARPAEQGAGAAEAAQGRQYLGGCIPAARSEGAALPSRWQRLA